MEKKAYIFTINTRDGVKVPNLRIISPDYKAAEQKIKNMYRYCEILESNEQSMNKKYIYDFEDIINLISKDE